MLSEIFLNSRNEAHLARVSIFVHLVTDHIFIYPVILYRLFYFILFRFNLFYLLFFIDEMIFLLLFFHLICDNLPCSRMFRNVAECSGMFRDVPECSMFRVLLTPNPHTTSKISPHAANKIIRMLQTK